MIMNIITEETVQPMLAQLEGWAWVDGGIEKTYTFRDFTTAFGWMVSAAILAEKHNHHPEWSNVYNRVSVRLTTHDAGGLTDKDIGLATAFEGIFAS